VGIPRGTVRLLLDEAKRRPFSGRVLQLGRMSVFFRDDQLASWAREQGVELAPVERVELSHDPRLAALDCLSDVTLFRRLGFSEVACLDYSDWEKPDHVWDLNLPVPAQWHATCDCIFESGTIQHVFHLPNVLANIHGLLKPGGRVVHGQAPSHNHVDHGFVMFSPTYFQDFYEANGWTIDASYWFEFDPFWFRSCFESPPWRIRRYRPGALDRFSYGGFGRRQVSLFVVATRSEGATGSRVPQQSFYRRFWSEKARNQMDAELQTQRIRRSLSVEQFEARLDGRPLLSRLWFLWKQLRSAVAHRLPRRLPPPDLRY
jgi:SAM-dependent methyltransferase